LKLRQRKLAAGKGVTDARATSSVRVKRERLALYEALSGAAKKRIAECIWNSPCSQDGPIRAVRTAAHCAVTHGKKSREIVRSHYPAHSERMGVKVARIRAVLPTRGIESKLKSPSGMVKPGMVRCGKFLEKIKAFFELEKKHYQVEEKRSRERAVRLTGLAVLSRQT